MDKKPTATLAAKVDVQSIDLKFDKNDIVNIGVAELENKLTEEYAALKVKINEAAEKYGQCEAALSLFLCNPCCDPEPPWLVALGEKLFKKFQADTKRAFGLNSMTTRFYYQWPTDKGLVIRFGGCPESACPQTQGRYKTVMDRMYGWRVREYALNEAGVPLVKIRCSMEARQEDLHVTIDKSVTVETPKNLAKAILDFYNSYEAVAALDKRLIEVYNTLQNMSRVERQMRAMMAKKLISASPSGQALMQAMENFQCAEGLTKALPAPKSKKRR